MSIPSCARNKSFASEPRVLNVQAREWSLSFLVMCKIDPIPSWSSTHHLYSVHFGTFRPSEDARGRDARRPSSASASTKVAWEWLVWPKFSSRTRFWTKPTELNREVRFGSVLVRALENQFSSGSNRFEPSDFRGDVLLQIWWTVAMIAIQMCCTCNLYANSIVFMFKSSICSPRPCSVTLSQICHFSSDTEQEALFCLYHALAEMKRAK